MRCAVLARLAQGVGDAPVGQDREALEAERGTGAVAAEPLESVAVALVDHDARVHVESVDLRRPGALAPGAVLVVLVGHRRAVLVEAQEGPTEERGLHACFGG